MERTKIKLFLIFFFLFSFLGGQLVFALEINYPRLPGVRAPQDFIDTAPANQILSLYILYFFNLIIWSAGLLTFGVLIYAGILYLLSSGRPERILAARNQITDALLGILLLFSSVMILQTLNTQLVILEVPKAKPAKVIERAKTQPPPTEFHLSAIDTEIPFAKIIEEKLFATSTMSKVKENAIAILKISRELEELDQDLAEIVNQCSCDLVFPRCDGCESGQTCTSDPCLEVRGGIEGLQGEIREKIEKLSEEQKKTIDFIRLLREELTKLERAKEFMLECPLSNLNSLAEFLNTKNFYQTNKWLILDIKFWEKILTIEDWANFYCSVSGTVRGRAQYTPPKEMSLPELPEEITREPMSCLPEAPVGEIIDRAERTGSLLIKRLEEFFQKSDKLIEAKKRELVLVSQCSSQRCISVCALVDNVCQMGCAGIPCPFGEIVSQRQEIEKIVREIEKVVKEKERKEMGIVPIIERVVPKIIKDLDREVREPMKTCVTPIGDLEKEEEPTGLLLTNCQDALGAIGPDPLGEEQKGVVIENCCLQEPEFKECLQECHLAEGQKNYRECLQDCLRKKSEELRKAGRISESEIIATCRHKINFYCCGK